MPRSLATFSSSSQFSFVDSVQRDRLHNTSLHLSTFTRISFFARAMISHLARAVLSFSISSSRHYFHAVTSPVVLFSRPFPPPAASSRATTRARSHAILLRVVDSLPRRHLSHLNARTPFLLSEGHWNRIKLYAGFSMPPFPPVAMKGGIRHDGRFGRRKMGRSRLNEVGRNFLGLLSNVLMQRDN